LRGFANCIWLNKAVFVRNTSVIFKTKINHGTIFSPCIAMGMTLNGTPIYEHNAYKNINKDVAYLGSSRFYNDQKKETWVLQFTPKASL